MNRQDIANQTVVENRLLQTLMEGISATLAWNVRGNDLSRKLTTLRFITQSLQRHLDHLLGLEEFDGYMDYVVETRPQLSKTVDSLRQEHDAFRNRVRRLVHRLETVSPTDSLGFARICEDLEEFLEKLKDHGKRESEVMQEAFKQVEGGEG